MREEGILVVGFILDQGTVMNWPNGFLFLRSVKIPLPSSLGLCSCLSLQYVLFPLWEHQLKYHRKRYFCLVEMKCAITSPDILQ